MKKRLVRSRDSFAQWLEYAIKSYNIPHSLCRILTHIQIDKYTHFHSNFRQINKIYLYGNMVLVALQNTVLKCMRVCLSNECFNIYST